MKGEKMLQIIKKIKLIIKEKKNHWVFLKLIFSIDLFLLESIFFYKRASFKRK